MINLIHGDCMEALKGYLDNHFDVAIVDPPYGKRPTRENNRGVKKNNFTPNDDKWDIKPSKKYFNELFRVSKNQIIWGGNYFIDNLKATNCFIIWDKEKVGDIFSHCEMAWTSFTQIARIYKFQWHGMLQGDMKNKEKVIHPTQKPVKLYKWLLENYTNENDLILDTHLGSGSIAIACHYMKRNLIGYEIDKEYYDSACKRFKEQTIQQTLF